MTSSNDPSAGQEPSPAALPGPTWASLQLSAQMQRNGLALAEALHAAFRQAPPGREPSADPEAEP